MKATRAVLSNVASIVFFENTNEFTTPTADEQTFQEIELAVAIKRALASGAKRITIDIVEDKKK